MSDLGKLKDKLAHKINVWLDEVDEKMKPLYRVIRALSLAQLVALRSFIDALIEEKQD